MDYIFGCIIFLIVLFLYMHITYQYKRSQDLEIYETDYYNNEHLQEICNVKQPIIFEFESILPTLFENTKSIIEKYGICDIKVKNVNDYYKKIVLGEDNTVDSVLMTLNTGNKVFMNDSASHYYSENNQDFLEDSGLTRNIEKINEYLKPNIGIVNTKYDYIMGSYKTCTPLRYHYDYRFFYIVISGKINVKMTPWKSNKYLNTISNYETYEFFSNKNVWDSNEKDMEKIKFIEFDVNKGNILYIPPYWWYTIQFTESTALYSITYNSLVNVLAYTPEWVKYFIQQQNINKTVSAVKKIEYDVPEKQVNEDKPAEDTNEEQQYINNPHELLQSNN